MGWCALRRLWLRVHPIMAAPGLGLGAPGKDRPKGAKAAKQAAVRLYIEEVLLHTRLRPPAHGTAAPAGGAVEIGAAIEISLQPVEVRDRRFWGDRVGVGLADQSSGPAPGTTESFVFDQVAQPSRAAGSASVEGDVSEPTLGLVAADIPALNERYPP